MIIIGAKGFAKEILEIVIQNNQIENLCFYDDVNKNQPEKLYDKFPILKNENDVVNYFLKNKSFTIGIGNPNFRKTLFDKFVALGGTVESTISKNTEIGSFNVTIDKGCNILSGVIISNDVKIGKCNIIYYHTIITHDVQIGDFNEISPSVKILGRAKIGNFNQIGSGAIILPDITIGDNCIIAAGAVVTKNVPSNVMLAGVPANIKKSLNL